MLDDDMFLRYKSMGGNSTEQDVTSTVESVMGGSLFRMSGQHGFHMDTTWWYWVQNEGCDLLADCIKKRLE